MGVGVGRRGQRVCRARIWQEKIGDRRGMRSGLDPGRQQYILILNRLNPRDGCTLLLPHPHQQNLWGSPGIDGQGKGGRMVWHGERADESESAEDV